ncbi:MAG: lipoate-protein ligase A [Planctomycetota bacterium]|jgi:lipoate-protein ligase A
MRLIIDPDPGTPSWNMAVDEALLNSDAPLTLRFYCWSPHGLSLGYFQDDLDDEALKHWNDLNVQVVRRLTGGGAILHGEEITYSLTGPDGQFPFDGHVDQSYKLVHDTLIKSLQEMGVPAAYAGKSPSALKRHEQPFFCFTRSTCLDILAQDRKLVGSAKRRRNKRVLQHGSIVLAPHPHGGPMASVQEWCPVPPDVGDLMRQLGSQIADELQLSIEPTSLADNVLNSAHLIELEKYFDHRRRPKR